MVFSTDSSLVSPCAGLAIRQQPPRPRLAWVLLLGLSAVAYQCQPAAPAEQPATTHKTSPDSLKLETAVATPLPKFDLESPILRQLALLPPAERTAAPEAMRQYQRLTRRFWLAQYSTDYLLKQAQHSKPNPPVFAQQLALIQSHWRKLTQELTRPVPLPPAMADHATRMRQVARYQQAALSDLQADCEAQRPPQPDAATLAAQQEVQKLLAPMQREPGPINVQIH